MKTFKIGDTVRIRKDSEYYENDEQSNPRDISGVIVQYYGLGIHLPIRVKWANDKINSYREEDLEFDQPYINEEKMKSLLGVK